MIAILTRLLCSAALDAAKHHRTITTISQSCINTFAPASANAFVHKFSV